MRLGTVYHDADFARRSVCVREALAAVGEGRGDYAAAAASLWSEGPGAPAGSDSCKQGAGRHCANLSDVEHHGILEKRREDAGRGSGDYDGGFARVLGVGAARRARTWKARIIAIGRGEDYLLVEQCVVGGGG